MTHAPRTISRVGRLTFAAAAPALAQPCQPHWDPIGAAAGLDGGVHALHVFDDGRGPALFVGGAFVFASGQEVKRISRWDGFTWSPLGSGVEAPIHGLFGCCARVYSLESADVGGGDSLFVGGEFITAGGLLVESVAAHQSGQWTGLDSGLLNLSCGFDCGPRVLDLLAADTPQGRRIYLAGTFTDSAQGRSLSRVAAWDGQAFRALGTGIEETPNDPNPSWAEGLAVFDDGRGPALYACGRFGRAGGVEVHDVARWDGVSWSDVGGGLASTIPGRVTAAKALAVFDDGRGPALYVTGEFDLAGGQRVSNIARWDGSGWSDVGGGLDQQGLTLRAHGGSLYAGGQFSMAGGAAADHIASWDGSAWSPLGAGVDGDVHTLQTFDDGSGPALIVGGWFTAAGGQSSPYLARWTGCQCYADCDQSTGPGALDIFDFLCFQNRYTAGVPYACDCDTSTGVGVCDIFDFLCFQNAFDAGCP